MIDVFVDMPGASPTEVEQRVTRPLEQLLWEVPGVEYLYSTSSPGRAMIVVRFFVGQDEERALVRLNQKLAANAMRLPPGASLPLVQARSIDDVPVMALTLWGAGYDDVQLRQMGGAAPGDVERTAGHLRDHDHRWPAAARDGRSRPGRAGRTSSRSARRSNRRWRDANVRSTSGNHGSREPRHAHRDRPAGSPRSRR